MADKFKSFRDQIDNIDNELLELLNKRAAVSVEVGKVKAGEHGQIFRPFREKEVLDRLAEINKGPLPEEHVKAIYREILSSSRRLQRPERVVYLGPEGTYSYFAGKRFLGSSVEMEPKKDFEDIFRAVALGEADLGVIPLENSMQGTVGHTVDLFMRYPVHIQAEIFYRIGQSLLGNDSNLSNIKEVLSHAKALEQCTTWVKAHLPMASTRAVESTAKAAQMVAADPDGRAAVGHAQLAGMFGLKVLASRIEDYPDNWTRFFVIGAKPAGMGNRDKTSLLFTTPDKPGALAAVLNLLAKGGINMTKLESRPFSGERWKYIFFADLECDLGLKEYQELLDGLKNLCHTLRVLGSYPTGPSIDPQE